MRIPNGATRSTRTLLPAVLASALLMAPSTAFADQTPDEDTTDVEVCQIDNASLQWGLKESFRAYISGTIANGSWEASDGASYETPNFLWSDGSGTYDPASGTGEVTFEGTVHFTGHDGVLDLTIANPIFEFEGDGQAALLLDTTSSDMEGEVAVDDEQQWVGDISLDDEIAPEDGPVELTDMSTTLTNTGAAAFAGFYEAGEALDPVNVSFEMTACGSDGAPTDDETTEVEPAEEPVAQEPMVIQPQGLPWLPISLGGLALLIIGFTVGIFVGGRKPKQRSQSDGSGDFNDLFRT